jgi:hypothetical protein
MRERITITVEYYNEGEKSVARSEVQISPARLEESFEGVGAELEKALKIARAECGKSAIRRLRI